MGLIATGSTGFGGSNKSTVTSAPRAPSTSPVDVSLSFATAAMSPAGTSAVDSCSFPRMTESWWSRSSDTVRLLTSDASVLIDPCRTLNRFTRPTYGSTIVLNTNATGGAAESTSSDVGAGPSCTTNEARRSTPMSLVPLPHSTGNTVASAMPLARACSSSFTSMDSSAR